MDTILNLIAVPGWEQLKSAHPTRAIILQALTNLELSYYLTMKPALPTRKDILSEAIRLGADLSASSGQAVQRHLDALVETGHAIKTGAGKAPWRSRYVLLSDRVREGEA